MARNSSARLKRDLLSINNEIRRGTAEWGQTVQWFEFDPTSVEDQDSDDEGTTYDDDLYDEGGSQVRPGVPGTGTTRRWLPPKTVAVYNAILDEGGEQYGDEGVYTVDRLQLIVQTQELIRKGIRQPQDRGAHTNDRILFDGRLFSVDSFRPRGRIGDSFSITVTVDCLEVKDDELSWEPAWDYNAIPVPVPPPPPVEEHYGGY